MTRKRAVPMIAAAGACLLAGGVARSAPRAAASHAPTAAEFAALKQQVAQQGEQIMRLTQVETQHYEILLNFLKSLQSGRPLPQLTPAPAPAAPPAVGAAPPTTAPPTPADGEPAGGHAKSASISGHVDVKGKARGPIYVYVDNLKDPAVERRIEIVQRDRAFVPNVVIAQRGTHVSFPNADPVLHNVFSPSPTQPFDLGSYKQGEKAGNVRLFKPGVVEVFCNMHEKMRADILVVPNHHYVKVNPDGSFRLDNVPIGARQISAWTPDAQPTTETVNLTAAGASVKLAVEPQARPHIKKNGVPYESYEKE